MRCEGCGAEVLLGSANCGSCGRSLLGDGPSSSGVTVTDVGAAFPAPPPPATTSFDAPPPPPSGWTLADGPGRHALLPPPPTGMNLKGALAAPKDKKGCGCGALAAIGVAVVAAAVIGVIVAVVGQVRTDRVTGPDLALGETVRFEIGGNDIGVHALSLGEGAVTITVRSRDSDFDPKLKVTTVDGGVLGENDDAIGLDSQLSFTLSEGADLVVEVREFSGDAGRYEVEVSSGAEGPTIDPNDFELGERIAVGELALDETVEQHLGADDIGVHHLTGFEGRVAIRVTGSDPFDPVLRVVAEDGTVIGENDDTDGHDSFLTFVLSPADSLDLEVREFSGDPGSYAIHLQRGDGTSPPFALGDPLRLGLPVLGEVLQDQVVRHDFTGDGAVVVVDVISLDGFDPMVRVISPNGDVLAEDDDGGEDRNSHVELELPAAATVTVEVLGYAGQPGRYEVVVR